MEGFFKMSKEEYKPCVLDEDFISFSQYVYLCNFVFVYIDDTYGNMLEDRELSIIYKAYSNKMREYASFNTLADLYKYIKNKCETDNMIKHIRFRIGNAVFCLAKREEV